MIIELKKLKVHEDMSEETTCFSAEIWVDGARAAYAKNEGMGGCNMYNADDRPAFAKFQAEAKRLHPDDFEVEDALVGDLMDKIEQDKFVKKCQKQGFRFVVRLWAYHEKIKGQDFWTGESMTAYMDESQLEGILKKAKAVKHEVIARDLNPEPKPLGNLDVFKGNKSGKWRVIKDAVTNTCYPGLFPSKKVAEQFSALVRAGEGELLAYAKVMNLAPKAA